jgi:hypothetical protein
MRFFILILCLLIQRITYAENVEIYEYKNANGVTVFTNNPDKVKGAAKIAPLATMQIYSAPAIERSHKSREILGSSAKENLSLNNEGRKKILQQEYEQEIKLLKAEQENLQRFNKNKINDKQQIKEISDNIIQHKDNIEILKSQLGQK